MVLLVYGRLSIVHEYCYLPFPGNMSYRMAASLELGQNFAHAGRRATTIGKNRPGNRVDKFVT